MTLNPKFQRYADRIKELITEGNHLSTLETPSRYGGDPLFQGNNKIVSEAWRTKAFNIISLVFGEKSTHFQEFTKHRNHYFHFEHSYQALPLIGVLTAALDDLEHGFLDGQEFIVASEVFDSVLRQAKFLLEQGFKDVAAVLMRIVVEDALRRLSRQENLEDTGTMNTMNQGLWKANRYTQPQWNQVQAWITIGNKAAHGEFNQYDTEMVKRAIEDLERFLVNEFRT